MILQGLFFFKADYTSIFLLSALTDSNLNLSCVTPQSDLSACPPHTQEGTRQSFFWSPSTCHRHKLTLIIFSTVTFWPSCSLCGRVSPWICMQTYPLRSLGVLIVDNLNRPPLEHQNTVSAARYQSQLSPTLRLLWIHKELVSIIKGLLNYWPPFTSLGFTVPFPSCFLTSIACPALTYLPVHLFRWGGGAPSSFPPLSAGLLAQAVNLSAGGMVAEEEGESNGGVPVRLAR